MKYLSVCSGIEAATVAWHPLGWQPVAFGEIEKFPCQVLEHHYPDTPNWGDMTKFKEWQDADVNVFVGGTPCQSFSVAGLRKGLDDPRGNLMLTYLAIAARYRPQWLVWENVPGVLSSNGGLDFASLLRGMGELGYGFAYRILDAQYFGVAQRRRRVFVVGYLGDWRRAAAVLFERHSLSGHPAPSRKAREGVAANAREGAASSRWPAEISSTLDTTFGTKQGLEDQHVNACCPMFVPAVKTLVGLQDCNNFSSEITGTIVTREGCAADTSHMVMQPIALAENTIGRKPENGGNGDGFTDGGPMYTLNATGVHGVAQPIAFDAYNQTTSDTVTALRCAAGGVFDNTVAQPIAYALDSLSSNSMKSANLASGCNAVDVSKALDTSRGLDPSCNQGGMAVAQPIAFDAYNNDVTGNVTKTLDTGQDYHHDPTVMQAMAVRRLSPKECERLQGFPDNYTDIKPKGKATPDGPRYKALGNSMAVPVMAWIGKRIQEVDAICQTQKQ